MGLQQGLDAAAAQAGVRWTNVIVEPDHVALEYVAELIENGELHVPAPATAPLEDVVQVHRQMDDGHLSKTVLTI